MDTFQEFSKLARAVAPKLNIAVGMYEGEGTRTGVTPIRYRITANGQGLPTAIEIDRDTVGAAVAELKGAVAHARRSYEIERAIGRLMRDGAQLDECQTADIRRQLFNCRGLPAFDQKLAELSRGPGPATGGLKTKRGPSPRAPFQT